MLEKFEKKLFPMTSIVVGQYTIDGQTKCFNASGFFYTQQTPTEPGKKGPQWMRIDDYWFITNRHVVLPKKEDNVKPQSEWEECRLDWIEFGLRQTLLDGSIEWYPVRLQGTDLYNQLRLHPNGIVDVAAIDITKNIQQIIKDIGQKKIDNNIGIPAVLSNIDLPGEKPIPIEVTSDIVVASYPKGFYDVKNKFPIVKSGIIASAWGADFNGAPMFQIDAQLFPGSSGGLVISKPSIFGMNDEGQILRNTSGKDFILLGIYSGEFMFEDKLIVDGKSIEIQKSYGLGNVWYYYLIPEIIQQGVKI